MKKDISNLFLILSLMSGIFMVTSCNNQDDEQQTSTANNKTEADNPLTQAVGQVNDNMADLNFKDLEPLGTAIVTRSDDNDILTAFKEKLSDLISLLRGDIQLSLPYGQRFSYQSFNDVLDLSWELSGTLEAGRENDTYFLGRHSNGQGQAVFTASDGSIYTIDAKTEKDVGIYSWNIDISGARELIIKKGDEQILKIVSGYEKNRPIWMPLLLKGDSMTGEVIYHDYDICLSYNKESTHERKVELSYAKVGSTTPLITMTTMLTDDADIIKWITHDINVEADFTVRALSDLITFVGKSNNVNFLVVNGIELAKCIREGTTEEHCNELVNDFNANLSLSMLLSNTEIGDLLMSTVFDADNNCYKPTLMINSQFMGLENYPITQILESLGISLEDLLESTSQLN